MATYEQLGSELGLVRAFNRECDWNKTLHYCEFEYITDGQCDAPTPNEDLISEVLIKILKRGTRPFCSFGLEQKIIKAYGREYEVSINNPSKNGTISYQYNPDLVDRYMRFKDVINPSAGELAEMTFDSNSQHYEKDFFQNLTQWFPDNLANMIRTQVNISDLLPKDEADKFKEQRVDFLLTFPNGKSLVLEPGDHSSYPADLQLLDKQRDEIFRKQGIPTMRLENPEIPLQITHSKILKLINGCGGDQYLIKRNWKRKGWCNILSVN